MFVRNGAVTPGPSRECDITFFVKGRPKSVRHSRDSTVAARRVQSVTVPSSRVSRECCSTGLRSPPSKLPDFMHFLSAFYETLPSKTPSKNLVFTEKPLQAPSKNPSKKHLLLESLLRTLVRSVLLHDPLGVRPTWVAVQAFRRRTLCWHVQNILQLMELPLQDLTMPVRRSPRQAHPSLG